MNRSTVNGSKPSFALSRVKELAVAQQIRFIGKKCTRDIETYFGGTAGLVRVITQLEVRDFRYSKTDDLPAGCFAADIYQIWTDEFFNRQKPNINNIALTEYYLKFSMCNDVVLVMLSNHPGR